MIAANTQPESSAYHRSSLQHTPTGSSVSSSSDQWPSARPSPGTSTPARPTSRGATGSGLRNASISSSSSTSQPTVAAAPPSATGSSTSHTQTTPVSFEQSHPQQPHLSSSSTTITAGPTKRASEEGEEESTPPVKLQNLSHVVDLVKEDSRPRSPPKRSRGADEDRRRYEISGMPVPDVIEMVAGLLTKITTTNDRQHDQLHRSIPPPEATAGLSVTTNSVLAFHGKNVPSITILSYLSRIHKYCPTTYEVFLSLLVYFDRMTERVNKNPYHNWRTGTVDTAGDMDGSPAPSSTASSTPTPSNPDAYNFSHFFVVDSFNIHRLVIAGVTCASKFFSDVFYTNSRYAKVGGLPLAELNHLELQFLILNDFRLSVPVEELEAYGTMLVQFYAREAVSNAHLLDNNINPPPPPSQPPTQPAMVETETPRVENSIMA
ncbi:cyclin-domain-containing protein [Choiromyces venosus 120613-1]|uniref:Cyclin-domain-containing protein n=1 Tax=Choiromyces venosus 120613-1 TaxID=1336337 RepID=A0A3N4JAD6_9PEZI|nr:cyclin-domain-containing protein [Choiromyces venosus 120613-1]